MYEEEMGGRPTEGTRKGGISRADLPSCGEMADHHRRIIREPNIFSSGASLLSIRRDRVCAASYSR